MYQTINTLQLLLKLKIADDDNAWSTPNIESRTSNKIKHPNGLMIKRQQEQESERSQSDLCVNGSIQVAVLDDVGNFSPT